MKAVILAGGFGTRLAEETVLKPKPMVEVGGLPIMCHIMHIYAKQGVNEFLIAAGYKAEMIKDYFLNFYARTSDVSIDLSNGDISVHDGQHLPWKVHVIDTGLHTQTGGRLKRLKKWLDDDEPFHFTYGDGVADIDIRKLTAFHKAHGKPATVTTVHAPARFGRISYEDSGVCHFHEKPEGSDGWINGGYFVLNKEVLETIDDDTTIWERKPIETLSAENKLIGYQHDGFWSCMDTIREKTMLEELWNSGQAPWKIWE